MTDRRPTQRPTMPGLPRPAMTAAQRRARYRDLVAQGYTREHARRRAGLDVPTPTPPATPARHLPAPPPPEDISWRERGLCAQTDPEAWFPEKGGDPKPAKRVCRGCDVREECLAYALRHRIRDGIWGGTSARERRHLTAIPTNARSERTA